MSTFLVRDLQAADIPFLDAYWQSLTPEDLRRMAIDPDKRPSSVDFLARLTRLLDTPIAERPADPLIWQWDGRAIGFTNLNSIVRGSHAEIHLHMGIADLRGKGLGRRFFMMSVREYLKRHELRTVVCQPAAANPFPNAMMRALGVPIARTYTGVPSVICHEHEVNRYEMDETLVTRLLAQWD